MKRRYKNPIHDPYTDKRQTSVRAMMISLCIAGLVGLALILMSCGGE